MSSEILNYFPKVKGKIETPRQCQIDVLNQVDELIKSGERKIIICAPTGSGKSGIAVALLNKYGGTYTSPLNVLVDQISSDFEGRYIVSLKGREHYRCIANTDYSCADGFCQLKKCSVPEVQRDLTGRIVKSYPARHCDDCHEFGCKCNSCIYKSQKAKFVNSNAGNTNFTMFQMGITNDKDMIVIDECDDIESFIRMFNSVTIDECLLYPDFKDHVEVLREKEIELESEIEYINTKIESEVFIDIIKVLNKEKRDKERQRSNILKLLVDWDDNNKIWCVTNPNNNCTKYEPIVINRFLDELITDKIAVLLSATPIRLDGFKVIEVGSQFPKEIRPWKYVPMGNMSLKQREYAIPQIAQFLSLLKGKTVVHCNAYSIAETLSRELSILGIDAMKQITGKSNGVMEYNRKDIVGKFKESDNPNEILLSVNLARGVDFPEDDIVNNVIIVVPWPNPTDKLVRTKSKILGTHWQNVDIANTIMQAYGRVNRNDKKQTMTYILDTNFNNKEGRGVTKNWFDKNRDLFFNWFLEAELKHDNNMSMCPVCGMIKPNHMIYYVKYKDYMGMICHECNKEKYSKE